MPSSDTDRAKDSAMPSTVPMSRRNGSAHLTGSVPLGDAEEVFLTVSQILGNWLSRIPDGETSERTQWINWQVGVLAQQPAIEAVPPVSGAYVQLPQFRVRPGSKPTELTFGDLGYARVATTSYATFASLKRRGVIPSHCRFQVSLPTPLAPITVFVVPEDQARVEPAYEAAMLAELAHIVDTIPADELAVQWDVAVEFGVLEGAAFRCHLDSKDEILTRLARLGGYVPTGVELGYHLCYGDLGRKHFVEPTDTTLLVEVANTVLSTVPRPVHWIHLPVPRSRTDDAYFAPLADLRLHRETELYLGLVHDEDGIDGARERIAAARRFVTGFGIATECGLGRRPPETIVDLLRLHEQIIVAMGGPGTPPVSAPAG